MQITSGGLRLDDYPNTGGQPSAAREVDLSGGLIPATLQFDFHTSSGVDSSDAVTVEVSSDGGTTYTELETLTGIRGAVSGSRSFDISAFASANTRVRFRVSKYYGGNNEHFFLDYVQVGIGDRGHEEVWSVEDRFELDAYDNNDGTLVWSGSWVEVDPQSSGAGPSAGQVRVAGGELRLDDYPNTGGEPSAARAVDLSGNAATATLSFDYRTSSGVDASDAVSVEISSDGGTSYTELETITAVSGASSGSRDFDISVFASADTVIRFRVSNLYGGSNEYFYVDNVRIELAGDGS